MRPQVRDSTASPPAGGPPFAEYCVCPKCLGSLTPGPESLRCPNCDRAYPVVDGVAVLRPEIEDSLHQDYLRSYEELAGKDLQEPVVPNREPYQETLRRFVGDVRGRRVLDIGSSQGLYLRRLNADLKVALDLALPYLKAVPQSANIARVCGDAEALPIKPGFFDVIILSGMLEHVLRPEAVVGCLERIATPRTRIVALIPWEEDLSQYRDSKYEFTHLRTFNSYNTGMLFRGFRMRKRRFCHPILDYPIFTKLEPWLPLPLYKWLWERYVNSDGVRTREYARRSRWIEELPRRERWLLWFYKPVFRLIEFRKHGRRLSGMLAALLGIRA